MSPTVSQNFATESVHATFAHPRSRRLRARTLGIVLASLACATAAASSARAEECPNAAFRTGAAAHLPDCRAYELVTPPYKNAGYMSRFSSDPEGSPGVYIDTSALPDAEGFQNIFQISASYYLTERTASGWTTRAVDLPSSEYLEATYRYTSFAGSSLDNRTLMWQARGAWEPENRIDLFVRRADRSIEDVGPMLPPSAPSGIPFEIGQPIVPEGASADASRVFFTLTSDYWPFDETTGTPGTVQAKLANSANQSLYEYVGTGNAVPLLVGVDDAGRQISQCGDALGPGRDEELKHNVMSLDGNTVFFTALPKSEGCVGVAPPVAELFARIDNGKPGAHTVAISEPSKEDCAACDTDSGVLADATFQGASEDGSKVVFSTTQPLLGGDDTNNLYEYDFTAPAGQRLVRVSAGDSTVSSPIVDVQSRGEASNRYAEISEDGSHIYFVASGLLTRTPNAQGERAEVGAHNLYVFERDSRFPDGHIAFVARTDPREENITPDGRFLVFTSSDDLTLDDTSTARQVFEYDAQTGALVRVSSGEGGYNDDGNASESPLDDAGIVSPGYIGYNAADYWSALSVSADGSYVFFQSPVGLTPEALDRKVIGYTGSGPVLAQNVYEYHDGRVSLVSDGQDITDLNGGSTVRLVGTDASGGDVFFSTVDRLVGQDVDTNFDVYDARIDGGFPAPAASESCSGEACQGALSATPALLSPGSEFQAGGNPPLAATSETGSAKQPKKREPKKKKRKPGRHRAAGRRGKAKRAAVRGRLTGKVGR